MNSNGKLNLNQAIVGTALFAALPGATGKLRTTEFAEVLGAMLDSIVRVNRRDSDPSVQANSTGIQDLQIAFSHALGIALTAHPEAEGSPLHEAFKLLTASNPIGVSSVDIVIDNLKQPVRATETVSSDAN